MEDQMKQKAGQVDQLMELLGIKKPSKFASGLGTFGSAMNGLGEASSMFRGEYPQADMFRGLASQKGPAEDYQSTRKSLMMQLLFPKKDQTPTSVIGPAGDPYAPFLIPILQKLMKSGNFGGTNPNDDTVDVE